MKLKIVFIDGVSLIHVINYDDVEEVKESIERKEKWIKIDGFYINLDNVAYIKTEDNWIWLMNNYQTSL